MRHQINVIRNGKKFSASVDGGTPLEIGGEATYSGTLGLSNDSGSFGSSLAKQYLFLAKNYRADFPYWADFIEPTAICEGQSFLSLNTYDKARFTFGFGQFAAHVANGDFVVWFRAILQMQQADDYFPDLLVQNGRAFQRTAGGQLVQLEDNNGTAKLQTYLNSDPHAVDDAEIVAAARLIHWTINVEAMRSLQVEHMIATAKLHTRAADSELKKRAESLDGVPGDLCCIVMDVLHQGRSNVKHEAYKELSDALKQGDRFEALLSIGANTHAGGGRVKNLREALVTRRAGLAKKSWSSAKSDFV
ncbi:MAG: hypothetical protein JWR80_6150 [Bradyrhizobium sp.]|nr:hypothetical protein [Bradyrhizobium sp.]